MPRRFDGVDDYLRFAQGGLGTISDQSAVTVACIAKRSRDSVWESLVVGRNPELTTWLGVLKLSADANNVMYEGSGASTGNEAGVTFTVADGWCFICASKYANSAPRIHRYRYSDGVYVQGNATTSNFGTSSIGHAFIGGWNGGDYFSGDIAAAAYWPRSFSDLDIRSLPFSLLSWWSFGPVAVWMLDQADVAMSVNDLTGGGANQTGIVGTSVSPLSVPVFNYGPGVLPELAVLEAPPAGQPVATGDGWVADSYVDGPSNPAGQLNEDVKRPTIYAPYTATGGGVAPGGTRRLLTGVGR